MRVNLAICEQCPHSLVEPGHDGEAWSFWIGYTCTAHSWHLVGSYSFKKDKWNKVDLERIPACPYILEHVLK